MSEPSTSAAAVGTDGFPRSGWTPPAAGAQVAPDAAAVVPPAPVAATAPAVAAATPIARIAGAPKTYMLDHPVSFDGITYAAVTIRNVRAGDIAQIDKAAGARALGNVALLLATPEGKRVPFAVLEAMDYGDGVAIIDQAEPYLQRAIAPKCVARFAGAEHAKTVPLSLPIEFDGRVYDHVNVRRLTARDFQAFFDAPPDQRGRLPAFVDDDGKPLPDAVLDAVGFDDNVTIMDAMETFIPGALKAGRAPGPSSAPRTGEASPQS